MNPNQVFFSKHVTLLSGFNCNCQFSGLIAMFTVLARVLCDVPSGHTPLARLGGRVGGPPRLQNRSSFRLLASCRLFLSIIFSSGLHKQRQLTHLYPLTDPFSPSLSHHSPLLSTNSHHPHFPQEPEMHNGFRIAFHRADNIGMT